MCVCVCVRAWMCVSRYCFLCSCITLLKKSNGNCALLCFIEMDFVPKIDDKMNEQCKKSNLAVTVPA